MEAYVSALLSPFDKKALGAQIPDQYSFPTETQFVRQEFLLTAQKVAPSIGSWDCIIMPNLFQSILNSCPANAVNLSGTVGGQYGDLTFQNPGSVGVGVASAVNIGGCVTTTLAKAQLESYRIVGYGVRIRPISSFNSLAGRIIVAATPVARSALYDPPELALASNVYQALDLPSIDSSGYLTTELLNMPDSMEASVAYIHSRGGIEFRGKMTAPAALSFRPTSIIPSSDVKQWGLATQGVSPGDMFFRASTTAETSNTILLTPNTSQLTDLYPCPLPIVGMNIWSVSPSTFTKLAKGPSIDAISVSNTGVVTITLDAAYSRTASAVYIFSLDSGTANKIVDPNHILNEGWTGLCIRGVGCVANDFAIEVMYHVEGPPQIGTAGTLTGASHNSAYVDPDLLARVNAYNNSTNSFKYVLDN